MLSVGADTLEMLATAVGMLGGHAAEKFVSFHLSLLEVIFLPAGKLHGGLIQVAHWWMSAFSWVGTVVWEE